MKKVQVRKVAEENGVDVTNQIKELEERAKQVRAARPSAALQGSPAAPDTAWCLGRGSSAHLCCRPSASCTAWALEAGRPCQH